MAILLRLLSSKTTWFMIAAALLAIFIGSQQVRIAHLKSVVEKRDQMIEVAKAELLAAQDLIVRWRHAYDNIRMTVEEQNAQVAKLEAETRRRIAIAREAMKEAEKNRIEADRLAGKITDMELSKNECEALQQLVDTARANGLR